MALSATNTYTITRNQAIYEALENLGFREGDETITDTHVRTFNLLLKALQEKGLMLWTWKESDLPLVAATQSYTLGPNGTAVITGAATLISNPLEINDIRLVDTSGNERPCRLISLAEYNRYTDKSVTGSIVSVCLNPGLDDSTLFVWPVNTSVTDVLRFRYKDAVHDLTDDADSIEVPSDCLLAIVDQLTARLAPKYNIPIQERIYLDARAKDSWDNIDDIEKNTSFFMQPARR